MRRNGPNILSHLALGNDGPHLSIDNNYVADFAIGNRGHGLCKVMAKGRSESNSAAYATGPLRRHPRRVRARSASFARLVRTNSPTA